MLQGSLNSSSILILKVLMKDDFLDHLRISHLKMTCRLIHCRVSSTVVRIAGVFRKTSDINFHALIFFRTDYVLASTAANRARPTIITFMSVCYLPKGTIAMMTNRCDRMKIGHQVDGCETSHIIGGLAERLGWLWGKMRLGFHQMWLLRSTSCKAIISNLMDRRISMLQVDHRSLRDRHDSLLCWNACLLLRCIFFTCIISWDTGRRDPHVTVKSCIACPNYLRIHVIAACWHSS